MIKNIIFDFGNVLVEWNMHYLFDNIIKDPERCDYFLKNVCNQEWNSQMDAGKPIAQGIAERIQLFPEWKNEIPLYYERWQEAIPGEIPGMYQLATNLKDKGYTLYGLSNWSSETFPTTRDLYPVFKLFKGYIVSGYEHLIKPDPKIFQLLIDRYQLKKEESVFIDDTPRNIIAAQQFGIKSILFKNCNQLKEELSKIL